jgi:aminoglycoside phosphotransferase (APT) family kinase protein
VPTCRRSTRSSLIHGDYRTGNFLYDEETNQITAWLDWELGHMGDRHEDLAWTMSRTFGIMDEDDKTFLIGGFLPRDEFLAAYEKASGLTINQKTLKFYDIFNTYKSANICLGTGGRVRAAARRTRTFLWPGCPAFPTWL